jgi:shikimate kinase
MPQLGDATIFLIGYRGTGKTSVARELASRLGYEWIDSDDVVEEEAGKTIAAIFADDGEAAFRDLESRVVSELSRKRQTVIALGGGAVLSEKNRQAIGPAGPIVWLTATVDMIARRLADDRATANRRPDLTATGGRAEIEAVLATRTPIYQQCATLIVDTENRTPAEVADEIVAHL